MAQTAEMACWRSVRPDEGILAFGDANLCLTALGDSVCSSGLSHVGVGVGDRAEVTNAVPVRGIHRAGCPPSPRWGYPNEEPIT
jgi:hypothetical protein